MIRFALAGWLLFFGLAGLAAGHHVPQTEADHGPDVPTVGSSWFDKIFAKNSQDGKVVYDVPYPIGELLQRVAQNKTELIHAMFPFSRSLQRPQDLSYDPLLNPRLTVAAQSEYSPLTGAKLFIGYVKARDQLEVISYNDEAGRFEYQIVTDYSRQPQVFYVDRGKCLTCHQGQAPIFSQAAWDDSTRGILGQMVHSKLGLDDSGNNQAVTERLFGPMPSLEQTALFDSQVRMADEITLNERVWVVGCGSDNSCRLGLLLKTLASGSNLTKRYFDHASDVIERSALKQQQTYSSKLSPNFGVAAVVENYGGIANVVNNPQALLDIIGLLYNLAPKDNPATPRPEPLLNRPLASRLIAFSIPDRIKISRAASSSRADEKVAETLLRLFENNHPIFNEDALNKPEIMATLLNELGSSESEEYAFWLNKATPEKKLFTRPLPPVFRQAELNVFSRHCYKCHAAGLEFPPQFLLGTEEEVVQKIKTLKPKILFKLQNNLMPPFPEDREILKNSGDYDRLINYLHKM